MEFNIGMEFKAEHGTFKIEKVTEKTVSFTGMRGWWKKTTVISLLNSKKWRYEKN